MDDVTDKYLWGQMTWPEIQEAAEQERVVLLPVGVIEQHGYHLPTQVDTFLADRICGLAAARMPDRAIVVPPVTHGYVPHHMDFPGTITVRGQVFIDYVVDVCKSIVSHGFQKLLILNGHGGNTSVLDLAAKITTLDTGAFCAFISHWELEPVKRTMAELRESPPAGGTLHADEYETSVYLAIDEDGVQMDKAVSEYEVPDSRYFWIDMFGGGDRITSARFIQPWSSFTKSGVAGDATVATKEKGERLLEAAVGGLVDLVGEMRERPIRKGVDHHGRERSDVVGDDWRVGPW
jgi:creatinine amidohydrolase